MVLYTLYKCTMNKVRLDFRIDSDLKARAVMAALKMRISFSEWIRKAIESALNKKTELRQR